MRSRLLILSALLGLASAPTWARWTDFAPRPFENGAYVEFFGSREEDDNLNDRQSFGWSDTFFREKITLFSNGYVYHPRFLQYQLSVGGGLKQENYSVTRYGSTGWVRDTAYDYDARIFLLPEHPYKFELFAFRREPLYQQQSSVQHNTVETSYGGHFRFRRTPYFFHAGYLDNTTHTTTSSTNVQRINVDGQYFKRFVNGNEFALSAEFNPSRFSGDLGLVGHSTVYGVTGLADAPRAHFTVTASKTLFDQESALWGLLESEHQAIQERLNVYFPLNFRTDFYYRVLDNTSTATPPGGQLDRELSDFSKDFQAILSNRLYRSLDSRYIYQRDARTSSGGDSTVVSNSLGFDYSKMILRGRLMAGAYLGTSRTDNAGRADIVNEPHLAIRVQGTFRLDQQYVLQDSIVVYLRSPLPPFESIRLVENVHYTVTVVANTVEIRVTTLPAQFVVPGTYDFFVSYSLAIGTFELQTDTRGFNMSVQTLDNLLTPYYSYVAVRSDVLSGVFPGIPLDSTTNTLGLTVIRGPWRGLAEYQRLDWAVSPYRSGRGEVQYVQSIDPTLRLYATGSYLYRYYPQGTTGFPSDAYSDQNLTLTGSVQKDFLSRTLRLTAGGSYSQMTGPVDSKAYSANSSVTWKIGKLDLSAGFDAYGSNAQATAASEYSRSHQYYYVKLSRRLF